FRFALIFSKAEALPYALPYNPHLLCSWGGYWKDFRRDIYVYFSILTNIGLVSIRFDFSPLI
ncbi:MAG: hypothetical protein COT45_00575, partial [bacterium (Candidatus Stahlbacteria) CG08_land_8_20_14_0_20_40_26]